MKQIGDINNLPKELNNPFSSDCVTEINIRTYKSWSSDWRTYGILKFEKGNTTGEQKFEGIDLIDVLKKIYTFINNL